MFYLESRSLACISCFIRQCFTSLFSFFYYLSLLTGTLSSYLSSSLLSSSDFISSAFTRYFTKMVFLFTFNSLSIYFRFSISRKNSLSQVYSEYCLFRFCLRNPIIALLFLAVTCFLNYFSFNSSKVAYLITSCFSSFSFSVNSSSSFSIMLSNSELASLNSEEVTKEVLSSSCAVVRSELSFYCSNWTQFPRCKPDPAKLLS